MCKTFERYGTMLRCYDNGGKTLDRYTIIPPKRASELKERDGSFMCIGASEHPFHPQGFGQHSSAVPGYHLGKRVKFSDLPPDVQKFALQSFGEYSQPRLTRAGIRKRLRILAKKVLDNEGIRYIDQKSRLVVKTPTRTLIWWASTDKYYVAGSPTRKSTPITPSQFLMEARV